MNDYRIPTSEYVWFTRDNLTRLMDVKHIFSKQANGRDVGVIYLSGEPRVSARQSNLHHSHGEERLILEINGRFRKLENLAEFLSQNRIAKVKGSGGKDKIFLNFYDFPEIGFDFTHAVSLSRLRSGRF